MREQELKSEPRSRHTLRERERQRLLRNRLLGAGVLLSLGITGVTAVRRALPQWLDIPGNSAGPARLVKQPPLATPIASPLPPAPPPVSASAQQSQTTDGGKSLHKSKTARRVMVSSAVLGPEILPVEDSDAPRRKRRRRRSAQQATTKNSAAAVPSKPAEAETHPDKPAEPPPAQPASKPPDDVPDNP